MEYWNVSGVIPLNILDHQIKLFAEADDALTSKLYYGFQWEETELKLFNALSEKSDNVFDIGGNIGLYTLLSAKANPNANVYCFEPNPINIERIKKNININRIASQVNLITCAVGESKDEHTFYLPKESYVSDVSSFYKGHTSSFSNLELQEMKVPVISIDDFISTAKVCPQLIKIDVELYEYKALKGMNKFLRHHSPVILIEIFNDIVKRRMNPSLHQEIEEDITLKTEQYLKKLDYRFYLVSRNGVIKVNDLRSNPESSMYLLTKVKLERVFYTVNEFSEIQKELFV